MTVLDVSGREATIPGDSHVAVLGTECVVELFTDKECEEQR